MKVNHIYFKRIVVITNMVAPYRIPLFNVLAKKLHSQLSVYFFVAMEKDRQWNIPYKEMQFEFRFLPGFSIELGRIKLHLKLSLFHYLMLEKPEVVIIGGFSFQTIIAMIYTHLMRKPFIIWSEGTLHSECYRCRIRIPLRRWLVKKAKAFIAVSKEAKQYFQHLGVPSEKIFMAIQTLDVEEFSKKCALFHKNKKSIKKRIGLKDDIKIILYSGQLIKRKGVVYLLKAFFQISMKYPNLVLLIVGNGPDLSSLKSFCKENNILNKVVFAGFTHFDDLPKFYSISDVFVFPTLSDTFGLVVNEAVAAGLPIICSKWAGAARDLVKDGVNGYIVNPQDVNTLTKKMEDLLQNDKKRLEMGRKSKEMIKLCIIEKAVQGFKEAIIYATSLSQESS